jgi:hypothetical protein
MTGHRHFIELRERMAAERIAEESLTRQEVNGIKAIDLSSVTRLTVVDETGSVMDKWNLSNIRLSLQDEGRTLKVLCNAPMADK